MGDDRGDHLRPGGGNRRSGNRNLKAATDYGRLNQLMKDKAEKEALLEEKMERWMYLNELAERIAAQK